MDARNRLSSYIPMITEERDSSRLGRSDYQPLPLGLVLYVLSAPSSILVLMTDPM
jgi:hypothetical protein